MIISIKTYNNFNINYIDAITNSLKRYTENYSKLISILKDNSIDINISDVFKEMYKIKSHDLNSINALSIIFWLKYYTSLLLNKL